MDSLTIDLFEPGMSTLHRAGLGGLACTLKYLDDHKEDGHDDELPDGEWKFDDRQVTLHWKGGDAGAGAFFDRLYNQAFGLRDGLIDLPGAYGRLGIKEEVMAELQQGMSLTILQFGPNRKTRTKTPKIKTYDDGDGHPMTIQHQDLSGYTHRLAWQDLVTSKGVLRSTAPVSGTIAPGFVQRHVAHAATTIEQPPGLALALHFALVGTLSLAIDRASAVLIVPDVQDLVSFVRRRHLMNPIRARDCQIKSPADAALQAQIRLRAESEGDRLKSERCLAVLFDTKSWNSKQKSRAAVLDVDPSSDELGLFEAAMAIQELQPRKAYAKPEKKGEAPRPFWSKGIVRAFVAENLARHDPWFKDFRRLVVSSDGATDDQAVRSLGFETKGLQAMIQQTPWQDQGERILVESVHEAMRSRFAAIGEDAKDPVTFGNRVDRQRQRWRLAFAGAKTQSDFRAALADLWSRSEFNPTLRASWREVLPLVCDERRWELVRDLALLALASYPKSEKPGNESQPVLPVSND